MKPFLSISILIWLVITVFSGICLSGRISSTSALAVSSSFHPYWGAATIIPLLILYYVRIRQLDPKQDRDALLHSYATVLGIVMAFFTGIAALMGFLPAFFHQVIVWPLGLFIFWEEIGKLKHQS